MDNLKNNLKNLIMEVNEEYLKIREEYLLKNEHKVLLTMERTKEITNGIRRSIIFKKIDKERIRSLVTKILGDMNDKKLLEQVYLGLNKVAVYNFNDNSLQESLEKNFSIVQKYIAGIIVEMFDINTDAKVIIDLSKFNVLFNELIGYLKEEYFYWEESYPIHGLEGETFSIEAKNVKIEKITIEPQNKFEYFYNYTNISAFNCDFDSGGYYITLKNKILKRDFLKHINSLARMQLEQVMKVLVLSSNGNLRYGRGIKLTDDWSIFNSGPTTFLNDSLDFTNNKDFYNLDEAKNSIEGNLELFLQDSFKIEESLKYAIERLKKAKQEIDINNKIVELALALEYSIKTKKDDNITKVLKEKSAILFKYEANRGYDKIKKIIHNFYDIRSRIMHGEEKYTRENDRILKKINLAEEVIRQNLLLLCKINQEKTLIEIDTYLEEIIELKEKRSLSSYMRGKYIINRL